MNFEFYLESISPRLDLREPCEGGWGIWEGLLKEVIMPEGLLCGRPLGGVELKHDLEKGQGVTR